MTQGGQKIPYIEMTFVERSNDFHGTNAWLALRFSPSVPKRRSGACLRQPELQKIIWPGRTMEPGMVIEFRGVRPRFKMSGILPVRTRDGHPPPPKAFEKGQSLLKSAELDP